MSLNTSKAILQGSLKNLTLRWGRIKQQWDDPVSHEIEKTFIQPVESRIRNVSTALARMEEIMYAAQRDCS